MKTSVSIAPASRSTQSAAPQFLVSRAPSPLRNTALVWLFAALALSCLAPANASAQADRGCPIEVCPPSLHLGPSPTASFAGAGAAQTFNLDLRNRVETGGKVYYQLIPRPATFPHLLHDVMDLLLNGAIDADTIVTQEGDHDGRNDERSVIIRGYSIILPTYNELVTLHADSASDVFVTGPTNAVLLDATVLSVMVADLRQDGDPTIDGSNNPVIHSDFQNDVRITSNDNANGLHVIVQVIAPPDTFGADLNQTILPEASRAITDSAINAITQRLEQPGVMGRTPGSFSLAGQSTLSDILTTGGKALAAGTLNLYEILGNSAFVMPLKPGSGLEDLTFWGGGDYRNLGGHGATNWSGGMLNARLGADALVMDNVRAGAALAYTNADLDYSALPYNRLSSGGDYSIQMTSITPYVGWSALPDDQLNVWAMLGHGWGEVGIADANYDTIQSSDAILKMAGGGINGLVLDSSMGQVRLKGEVMQTAMELEAPEGRLEGLTVDARRARVSLAASKTWLLADGAQMTPTVEVGMRHDAGDGPTGTGGEVGGGLHYADAKNSIMMSTQGRILIEHNGGYNDWGIGAILTLNPSPSGQGLVFRLTPSYGQTVTQAAQLWDQGAMGLSGTNAATLGQRMDAEMGYGMAIADGQSLLTPYGNMTWGQQGTRAYRLGSRLALASGMNLALESRRGETPGGGVNHGVLLNVQWGF